MTCEMNWRVEAAARCDEREIVGNQVFDMSEMVRG